MGRLDRICSTHWQIPNNHPVSAGWKCSFWGDLIVKELNTKKEFLQPTFISPCLLLSLPSGQQRSAFSPSLSQLWSLYATMLHSSHHSSHFFPIPSPISCWNHFLLSSLSCDEYVRARGQDRPGQLTFFLTFSSSPSAISASLPDASTGQLLTSAALCSRSSGLTHPLTAHTHTPTYSTHTHTHTDEVSIRIWKMMI